jgi:hypothetical protein
MHFRFIYNFGISQTIRGGMYPCGRSLTGLVRNLGDNIIEEGSFYEGVKAGYRLFRRRCGTADAGPTFLGADMPHNPSNGAARLEIMLVESRKKKVPMIVGSCSRPARTGA